jgi:putative addiction module killer protein
MEKKLAVKKVPIWLSEQPEKARLQIKDRFDRIEAYGHFGDHKEVDKRANIWELRWKSGRRIYFGHIDETTIVILVGGNKNGQDKDIRKAKRILEDEEAVC